MEYEYRLHREGEDPKSGFGYHEEPTEVAALWNSWTPETCPHKKVLDGAKCNLCGNKCVVTKT